MIVGLIYLAEDDCEKKRETYIAKILYDKDRSFLPLFYNSKILEATFRACSAPSPCIWGRHGEKKSLFNFCTFIFCIFAFFHFFLPPSVGYETDCYDLQKKNIL